LNDADLFDNKLSVGWGKAVKIYSSPFVVAHSHRQQSASALANQVKVFFSQFEFTKSGRGAATSGRDTDNRRSDRDTNRWERGSQPEMGRAGGGGIVVTIPSDRRLRSLIDETAKVVSREGDTSEQVCSSISSPD
jgi:hypothetical protein